jgi:hypothetical protein
MSLWPEPSMSELLWTVAAARLILPLEISLQVCHSPYTLVMQDASLAVMERVDNSHTG